MFKKLFNAVILLIVLTTTSFAQTKEFSNLMKYRLSGSGPILDNDNLLGYYAFYLVDKADRKTDAYVLQLMDDNLNVVKAVDILRPNGDYLVETVFNGSAFVIVFFNQKKGIEFLSYDKSGKLLGSFLESDPAKWEEYRINAARMDDEAVANSSVFPIGNGGFVRQSYTKNDKYGYTLTGLDNKMKVVWKAGSPENSEMIESADILYASEKFISIVISRRKNKMSRDLDTFLALIDAKTGKVIFEKPAKDDQEMSILNVFMNPEETELYTFGEYWPKGAEMLKDKSEGIVAFNFDLTGAEQIKKKYSWLGDLNKILKSSDNTVADTKDKVRSFFHRVHMDKSGNILAIGEQYLKVVSGLGIASRALGGGGSTMQINILNMVAVELGKDLSLKSFSTFAKKKTTAHLPPGYGAVNSTILAAYVKLTGGFDYEFATFDKTRDLFATVYRDYDRKGDDGKKADVMFGVIKFEDGKLSSNKTPLNITSSRFWLQPAKPGYITVVEYFKKKKTLSFRMEKIVY